MGVTSLLPKTGISVWSTVLQSIDIDVGIAGLSAAVADATDIPSLIAGLRMATTSVSSSARRIPIDDRLHLGGGLDGLRVSRFGRLSGLLKIKLSADYGKHLLAL